MKLRKAGEYLKDFITEPNFEQIEELIKQAQIDAIEETCRVCSESVKMKIRDNIHELSMNDEWMEIDKQSILSVADKLKKEL